MVASLAAAALTLLAPGLTSASAGPAVLPLPILTSSNTITSYKGRRVLEVLDMHVTKIARGAKLLITCGCKRRGVPIHETRTPTSRIIRGVDWLLTPGHAIHVTVTKPPALGRYMVLASNTQHHQLVFQTDGCLTASKPPNPAPPVSRPSYPAPRSQAPAAQEQAAQEQAEQAEQVQAASRTAQ